MSSSSSANGWSGDEGKWRPLANGAATMTDTRDSGAGQDLNWCHAYFLFCPFFIL